MGPGCVKTPACFHTDLFRSLFRGLRPHGIEKISKNFAPHDHSQILVEFSHCRGRFRSMGGRSGQAPVSDSDDLSSDVPVAKSRPFAAGQLATPNAPVCRLIIGARQRKKPYCAGA